MDLFIYICILLIGYLIVIFKNIVYVCWKFVVRWAIIIDHFYSKNLVQMFCKDVNSDTAHHQFSYS